jgi:hypothetical protein
VGGERGELSWKYYKQDSWVGRVTQIIASGLGIESSLVLPKFRSLGSSLSRKGSTRVRRHRSELGGKPVLSQRCVRQVGGFESRRLSYPSGFCILNFFFVRYGTVSRIKAEIANVVLVLICWIKSWKVSIKSFYFFLIIHSFLYVVMLYQAVKLSDFSRNV